LKSKNIADDLDLLYEDLSHADNYFQFLELRKRADEKQLNIKVVTSQNANSFISEINKRKFDFFKPVQSNLEYVKEVSNMKITRKNFAFLRLRKGL
jgi:hypothetical protein